MKNIFSILLKATLTTCLVFITSMCTAQHDSRAITNSVLKNANNDSATDNVNDIVHAAAVTDAVDSNLDDAFTNDNIFSSEDSTNSDFGF